MFDGMARAETSMASDDASSALLSGLRADGRSRERAITQLHEMLLGAARREALRRAAGTPIAGPELADIVHQAADDALVAIVAKLDSFRGESRFTTWAYKFVVLEVAGKLSRHAWRRAAPPSAEPDWERLVDRFGLGPAEAVESKELLAALRDAVERDLTERQRRVFVALVLEGVPLDALAGEIGSNRNAIYKTLFDARRKLRANLVANGYMSEAES
jgi:RNA polymerase sigma-70 factor (ECF subfamily)